MAENRASKSSATLFGAQHADRMRPQMRVHGVAHLVGAERLRQIEMRDLSLGVHAGVGASSAVHAHVLAAQRLRRLLEHALHRQVALLHLPAAERRAVILDGELVARHGLFQAGERRRIDDLAGAGASPDRRRACRSSP